MPGGMATYPFHEGRTTDNPTWGGTWDKNVNPYALKNVTALGDERKNHCVSTCHGDLGATNSNTKPKMGHLGWGAYNGTTLFEPRGTPLLQSNCGVCHDPHSSSMDKLMSDGFGKETTGINATPPPDMSSTPETAIDMNDCTLTCHVGRDQFSDYRTKGHGKEKNREQTVKMEYSYTLCTPCHTASVPHRSPTNPRRFGFTEDTADAGLPHNGSSNQLDDNYNGQIDEASEVNWTNKQTSICRGCHTTYYAHGGGGIKGASPSWKSASCLDCHDPHGKDVGNNIEMIRTTIAGEATTFQNTSDSVLDIPGPDDYYRNWGGLTGDRNGVCDNASCHGRDLVDILADPAIQDHKNVKAGDNCLGCHVHANSTGDGSFTPLCNICHGNPPSSGGLPDYSQGIGVHQRHTAVGIKCDECHYRDGNPGNVHNETAWTEPTGSPVPRVNVDVVFNTHGDTVNMNASYSGYDGGKFGTGTMNATIGAIHTCNNITCHNPDSNVVGTGLTDPDGMGVGTLSSKAGAATNNVVSWEDSFKTINTCTDPDGPGPLIGCHAESPAGNPDGGSHYKHDNSGSGGGKGFPCQTCHFSYYNAAENFGNDGGSHHSDGTLQMTNIVNISATLGGQSVTGTWADGTNTCTLVYCHGYGLGASGNQLSPVWGPEGARSGGACGDCHDVDPARDLASPNFITTGNHTAHLTASQGPNITCDGCHPVYALNSVNHVNGSKDFLNVNNATVTTKDLTDTCTNCHGTSVVKAKITANWSDGAFKLDCLECHDGSAKSARIGGVTAPKEDTYWTANGHGRTTTYRATKHGQNGPGYLCTVCHDQTSTHISGVLGDSNRFQSVADDGLAYTSKTSEVCLDCHKPGQGAAVAPPNHLGYDAKAEASIHSGAMTVNYNTSAKAAVAFPAYGNFADYPNSPGYQCDACHDPHGSNKLAMTRSTLNGMLGSPAVSNPVAVGSAFDDIPANTTLAGLDPTAAANDGACDACHLSSVNTNAHPDTSQVNDHNQGKVCVDCHDHKNSFFAGCSDCHGGATPGLVKRNYWPDGLVGPNTAGAHVDHIKDLAQRIYNETIPQLLDDPQSDARQKHLCKYCHGTNPGADNDHGYTLSLPAEVSANLGRIWDTANPPALTNAVTYNLLPTPGLRTCAAVECHYNTLTPGWLSGTAATCTTCHNNGTDNGALANAWPDLGTGGTGDHFAHYAALGAEFTTLYGATNTLCVPCHSTQQPSVDLSNIASMSTHMNGSRTSDATIAAVAGAYAAKVGGTPAYGGVTANDTCVNVSCHGGITTPAWQGGAITTASVITTECQKCHQRVDGNTNPLGTQYNDARSGAHIDHDFGCPTCHSAVPTTHYTGISTIAMDNPDNIGNATYFASYTDTTGVAVNPLTNGYFNDATTAGGVSGTCNTVTCHSNASPAWNYTVATCGFCHLDSPTSNRHQAHIYNGSTPDHTDCDQCHPSATYADAVTGTDLNFMSPGLHANSSVNLVAGLGATGAGPTVTCTTNFCHRRDTASTNWGTASSLTCNSCHYAPIPATGVPTAAGDTGTAKLGGTHDAHFFGAPTNIVCADCHVVSTADTVAPRAHMHNNGSTDGLILLNKAQATQDEGDVTAAALGTGTDPDQPPVGADGSSNATCNTALCHNPTPGASYSVIWTGAAITTCDKCHADTTGVPDSGSHAKHINYAAGYASCTQCHVNNGATIGHMTRSVELSAGMTAGYTASLAPPYTSASWGSCSAGACHDTDQDPAWGSSIPANDCYRCHINNNTTPTSSSDSPNFVGSDRSASLIGIGDEWALRGHGAKGAPANTCAGCHDGTATPHQPDLAASANPFRLGNSYTNPDAFCTNASCHNPLTAAGQVKSHTSANMTVKQRTWPSWVPKCVDCHDPHGDGANLGMITTDLFDRGSSTHGVPTTTLNTIPKTTDVIDFSVKGGIQAGSYAQTPGGDGICQECHLATDGAATGLLSFQDDNATALAGAHPTTNLSPCTQCHKHDKAFEPAGCNGCHGSTVTKQFWPDGSGGAPAYVDDSAGAHDKHMLAISLKLYNETIAELLADASMESRQKTICAFCHPDPGGATHTQNIAPANRVDVWFDGNNNGGTLSNYFQVYKGLSTWGNDTNATYDQSTGRCSNIDCHYTKATPAFAGAGWNGSGATDCEECHYFRGTASVGGPYPVTAWVAGDLPDAHQAHSAGIAPPSNSQSRNYPCLYCHTVPTTLNHPDGRIDLSTAGNPTLSKELVPVADETMTPGVAGLALKFGTNAATVCANLYCHGADFGAVSNTDAATQGTNVAPTWNNHLTGACGTCHDVDTRNTPVLGQTFAEGKHRTHERPETGYAYGPAAYDLQGCTVCHGVVNAGASLPANDQRPTHPNAGADLPGLASDAGWASFPSLSHVEGNFEVDFENQNRGFNSYVDYDGTPGLLAVIGTAYNNGTDICNRCHSDVTVSTTVGATLAKLNWNTTNYRFPDCRSCHNAGGIAAAWSAPVSGGVQAPDKETNYAAAGHGKVTPTTYGGAACVDCHDENSSHLSGVLGDSNRTNAVNGQDYATGANAFCASACHAVTETVHYDNNKTIGGSSDNALLCSTCHDPHGPSGQDAMINGTIAGHTVSGFASKTVASSYYNAGNTGVCQVCHDAAEVKYHNRTSGAGSTHQPNEPCISCHQHNAAVAFAPRSCESCHNASTPFVKGSATAPNVMGDGTSATGTGGATPKPYDNGTYGYNVNGHGRDDTPAVPGNAINVACSACHDMDVPAGTHLDGTIAGRLTPTDTRTDNSFHLLASFVKASPTSEQDVQLTFDNACATLCHGSLTMRHAVDTVPAANAVQFGTHATYAEPQNAQPPVMFFDRNLKSSTSFGVYDGQPNFALCVSCHDPHGTNAASPRGDLNNKMMLYKWANPSTLCVKCHL